VHSGNISPIAPGNHKNKAGNPKWLCFFAPDEFKQKKRYGIMEKWNNEMQGNTIGFPIFQHSIVPIFKVFPLYYCTTVLQIL
jgi:hypothetical protein